MTAELEIQYVTHASLLLRSTDLTFLIDPFYYPELDPILAPSVRNFPPSHIDAAKLGKLDFVFSSHAHHDHCHPETLEQLKDQIGTVLLPAGRTDLTARYTNLGFRQIVFLENRRTVRLGGGVEVTSYWDDPIDSMLLVKWNDGTIILHGNDCSPEVPTFSEIARAGMVDYAFLCSTSTQDLFPLLLPRPPEELEQLASMRENGFFTNQAKRIDALRPRVVIPYSYTASYLAPDQVHLNGYARLTPQLFRDRLATSLPAQDCWVLQPGDVVEARARRVRPLRSENMWGKNLTEFRANIAAYAKTVEDDLVPFDSGEPEVCDAALRKHLEERLERGVPHAQFYAFLDHKCTIRVSGKQRSMSYLVDLKHKTVTVDETGAAAGAAALELTIPASLMQTMLSGAYDPFMILYTYRVTFQPQPGLRARLTADKEYYLYLGVMLSLFMDRKDPLLAAVANLASYLGVAPAVAARS